MILELIGRINFIKEEYPDLITVSRGISIDLINSVEENENITLPESYKIFLQNFNGFYINEFFEDDDFNEDEDHIDFHKRFMSLAELQMFLSDICDMYEVYNEPPPYIPFFIDPYIDGVNPDADGFYEFSEFLYNDMDTGVFSIKNLSDNIYLDEMRLRSTPELLFKSFEEFLAYYLERFKNL